MTRPELQRESVSKVGLETRSCTETHRDNTSLSLCHSIHWVNVLAECVLKVSFHACVSCFKMNGGFIESELLIMVGFNKSEGLVIHFQLLILMFNAVLLFVAWSAFLIMSVVLSNGNLSKQEIRFYG